MAGRNAAELVARGHVERTRVRTRSAGSAPADSAHTSSGACLLKSAWAIWKRPAFWAYEQHVLHLVLRLIPPTQASPRIDLLLIVAIRSWVVTQPEDGARSWLTALRHPRSPACSSGPASAGPSRRSRARSISCAPRAPVHGDGRRAAARLPRSLADAPRGAAAEVLLRHGCSHRPGGRLHVGVRLQPSLRPPPRNATRPLPAPGASRLSPRPAVAAAVLRHPGRFELPPAQRATRPST